MASEHAEKRTEAMRDFESQWAKWMRAANAGDAASYRSLLDALIPYLRQAVRKGLGNSLASEAEDIVQEAILAIHLKRQTWDQARPILPWIRAIVKNKMVDRLRRLRLQDHIHLDAVADTLPDFESGEISAPGDAERMLRTLKDRDRRILKAIAIDGWGMDEVAARENMSAGAVRVSLHRALKRLSAALGKTKL
jgi:RNA polymerase sigma-70 factor, ECF subfamily